MLLILAAEDIENILMAELQKFEQDIKIIL
jgi:hypothetical protein